MDKSQKNDYDEILKYYNQIGLRIDKSVMETLDRDQVLELFMSLYDKLGIFPRSFFNLTLGEQANFNNSSNFENITRIYKVFYMTNYIFKRLKLDLVKCEDFMFPDKKKIKGYLLKLVRYSKQKDQERERFAPLIESKNKKINSITEKNNKIAEAQAKKQEALNSKTTVLNSENAVNEKKKLIENETSILNKKLSNLEIKERNLQDSIEEGQKTMAIDKAVYNQAKTDIDLAKERVVNSPIKVMQYSGDINQMFEEENTNNTKMQERIQNLNSLNPQFQSLNELISAYDVEILEEKQTRISSDETNSKAAHQKDIVGVKRLDFEEIKVNLEAKNAQELELIHGIESDNLKKNAAIETRENENVSTNNQLKILSNSNTALKNNKIAAEDKIKEQEEKLTKLNSIRDEFHTNVLAQAEELANQVNEFHAKFPGLMNEHYEN